MTQTLIEKLEALEAYEIGEYKVVYLDQIHAIIEQAKAEQSERTKEIEQILHDPENQPSQYGTMPLIEYEKIVAQRDRLLGMLKTIYPEQSEPVACTYCDNTGYVHRADGEYLGICPDCAPQPTPQDEKDKQIERLKAAFHLNMVKAYPEKAHAEITAAIDQAMKGE